MTITRVIVVLGLLFLLIGLLLIWLYAWALKLREVSRWVRNLYRRWRKRV